MSTLTQRAETVPRWADLPFMRASRWYFLLSQNARGLWVVRENTGKGRSIRVARSGLAIRALESSDEHFAIVHVNDGLEFYYAA